MKKLKALILFPVFLISCSSQPDISWTQGGTLHEGTVADWRSADDKNKLATCADFAANIKKVNGSKYESLEAMRSDAETLKNCIDQAAQGPTAPTEKIADLAVACQVLSR